MTRQAKISRGSWAMCFGLKYPARFDQTYKVLGAFDYDGIELGGFFNHATLENYPTTASRKELARTLADHGLEVAGVAYEPYGIPWAYGEGDELKRYQKYFDDFLQFSADVGAPGMRVDPGSFGPLPRDVSYEETYERVVKTWTDHAVKAADHGIDILWELESMQPFNKPSELIRILGDIPNPNFKILYDTGHFYAACTLAFNQVQPAERLEGGQEELIKKISGRIGHVHLSDCDGNIVANIFGSKLGFGKGFIDFETLVPLIADHYDGVWWSVDSIPMGPSTWEDSYQDRIVLDELLDKHVRNR
jgi:sugar phosphate isomerase/epimerase